MTCSERGRAYDIAVQSFLLLPAVNSHKIQVTSNLADALLCLGDPKQLSQGLWVDALRI